MTTNTCTKTTDHFVLNVSLPERLSVVDTSPVEDKTRLYSVVADYGWAEKILCSESFLDDANSIATILGEHLGIPVQLAARAKGY